MGLVCSQCKKPIGEDCLHCPYCGAELDPYGTISPPMLRDFAPPGRFGVEEGAPPPSGLESGDRESARPEPPKAPKKLKPKPKPPASSAPAPRPAPPPSEPPPQAPPYSYPHAPPGAPGMGYPPYGPGPESSAPPPEAEHRGLWGKLKHMLGQAPESNDQARQAPPPQYPYPPQPPPQAYPPQGQGQGPWGPAPGAPGPSAPGGPGGSWPPPQQQSPAPPSASWPSPGTAEGWPQPPSAPPPRYPAAPTGPAPWERSSEAPPAGFGEDEGTRRISGADLAKLKIPQHRYSLQILDSNGQWREWEKIGVNGLKVGRSKNIPAIPGLNTMAVRHLRLYYDHSTLMAEDLGSLNGVFVQLRVGQPVELESGVRFRVGNHVIAFQKAEPQPEAEPIRSEDEEEFWSAELQPVAFLDFIRPDNQAGVRFPIVRGRDRIILGRENRPNRLPVDITLPHDDVASTNHAMIRIENGRFYLEDLRSTNGTYLQIREPSPLQPDDVLLVGRVVLRVVASTY